MAQYTKYETQAAASIIAETERTQGIKRIVGQRCSFAGFPATIIAVPAWSLTGVEVRVPGGQIFASFSELRSA